MAFPTGKRPKSPEKQALSGRNLTPRGPAVRPSSDASSRCLPTAWRAGPMSVVPSRQPQRAKENGPARGSCNRGKTLAHPSKEASACRSEEHTSELQSLIRISNAVFCLTNNHHPLTPTQHYNIQLTDNIYFSSLH